ncbi:hypothetical protein [Methylobacter sp. S3L5C]|nr:hypothetical protein [Methylobacter sp. S3L5C]UOA08902.1 hypothetical protein KKZ03_00865 [Methylobacter sp. S3L5C]UOA08906.1 hypothetical protein KKZ03_00885 [Methylobacter sp. S3L5C]UOA08912.1 hypothetical protein KKZ03_00915 [Methylobacter sp. S3L5C]UOA08920.1 hypothetical protein KKZ03_00955 [Methylobacter sp. S3L5C]
MASRYPDQPRLFTEAISLFGGNSLEAFTTINKPRRLAVLVSQYPE